MKKTLFFLIGISLWAVLAGCNADKIESLESENAIMREKQRQDSLYITDLTAELSVVYTKLDSMRAIEEQIRRTAADVRSGGISGKEGGLSLSENMQEINKKLNEGKARIRELEARLSQKTKEATGLSETVKKLEVIIVQLKQTINDKDQTITDLQGQIGMLEQQVAGLKVDLAQKEQAVDSLGTELDQSQTDLNTAYYVIGTTKELKDKDVIVSRGKGFESSRDLKKFTKIDIREMERITVGKDIKPNKVTLLPARPTSSYNLKEEGGVLYIEIKDKGKFWQDKFLAVTTTKGLF
ncbi:MAG: hypothetical protein ACFCUI_04320 [Bernardetiaceae bacterium]